MEWKGLSGLEQYVSCMFRVVFSFQWPETRIVCIAEGTEDTEGKGLLCVYCDFDRTCRRSQARSDLQYIIDAIPILINKRTFETLM